MRSRRRSMTSSRRCPNKRLHRPVGARRRGRFFEKRAFFCDFACIFKPNGLSLRYSSRGQESPGPIYRTFCLILKIRILNSYFSINLKPYTTSKLIGKLIKQFSNSETSLAGQWRAPSSSGGFAPRGDKADYKDRRALKSCPSEFHRILWCGSYTMHDS